MADGLKESTGAEAIANAATIATVDHVIRSEALEPVAMYLIGRWFAKCQAANAAGDEFGKEDAWINFWYGLHGLQSVSVSCPEAVHFGLALSNQIVAVAKMIKDELGLDPMRHPDWKP